MFYSKSTLVKSVADLSSSSSKMPHGFAKPLYRFEKDAELIVT